MMMMKASSTLIASLVAASSLALSSSSAAASASASASGIAPNPNADKVKSMNSGAASLDNGRFAPRFDGLRFIETLITAHR